MFTKLIRELVVAAKQGALPEDNPRLRTAIDKALAANMTRTPSTGPSPGPGPTKPITWRS